MKNEPCVEESIKITPVMMQNCKCPSAWEIENVIFFKGSTSYASKLFFTHKHVLISQEKKSTMVNIIYNIYNIIITIISN